MNRKINQLCSSRSIPERDDYFAPAINVLELAQLGCLCNSIVTPGGENDDLEEDYLPSILDY